MIYIIWTEYFERGWD